MSYDNDSKGVVPGFNPDDAYMSATLPAKWYHDPAVYEAERENIFFRSWQFVGLSIDVSMPGDFIRARILNQELLITRDRGGQLRAFYNICTHRGALLTSVEKGNSNSFACPYHGWTFDNEGALKAAANSENMKCFDKANYGLSEVLVEELANMIFVNLDPKAESLRAMAGDLEDDIKSIVPDYDKLKVWRRDPASVAANWKIVVENFLECYHCIYTHPQLIGQPDSLCDTSFETHESKYWSRHIMRSGAERAKNSAYEYSPDERILHGYIWMLWPNTLLMSWPADSNFFIFHVIPDGPETTKETFDLLCIDGKPGPTEIEMFDYHSDVVNGEDIFVVEGVQKAIHSRGYRGGRYMVDVNHSWLSEHSVHRFARFVWNALNQKVD